MTTIERFVLRLIHVLGGIFWSSPQGRAFALADAAAIVAFFVSLLVARPAAARSAVLERTLGEVHEGERARVSQKLAVLRRRNSAASAAVVTLVLLVSADMAVARYLQ